MKNVKLLWDFRGENSFNMATHYHKHLVEFFESKEINLFKSGVEKISDYYHLTYAIIDKIDVNAVKYSLKPHRALLVDE